MLLVYGEPGYGKSQIIENWAVNNDAVFLRANVDWTPKYFLVELAKSLRLPTNGTSEKLFNSLLAVLAAEEKPLVIDEAESTLNNGAAVLEKIRDFSDRAENMVVLVGMADIKRRIAKHQQISSRIAQVVEFKAASLADVAAACKQLTDVDIAPDLVTEIHRQTAGRMRLVLNAIALVERTAKLSALNKMALDDMRDKSLVYEWQTGGKKEAKA
jgi:DNA transposition AAA+ family ATPase